jgi:antirepressor protein
LSTTLPIVEELVFLPKWGCTLTILFTPDGPYCVLRQLCQVIGVEDVRQQFEQLSKRQATREYVTKLPVQTARRGKQVTYCIHLDVLAWWLAGLNDRLIRPEFAPQLSAFRKISFAPPPRFYSVMQASKAHTRIRRKGRSFYCKIASAHPRSH